MADLLANCLTRFPEPSVHLRALLQNRTLAQLADKDFWFHSYSERRDYGYTGDDFVYCDGRVQIRHFVPRACSVTPQRAEERRVLYLRNTAAGVAAAAGRSLGDPHLGQLQVPPPPPTGPLNTELERLRDWRRVARRPDHAAVHASLVRPYLENGGVPYFVGAVHWDRRCEGPPGHVHGGAVFSALDLILGQLVAYFNAAPYVTYRLNLDYRKVVPLEKTLLYKVWVERDEDSKAFVRGYTFDPFRDVGLPTVPDVANIDFAKCDINSKYYHHTIDGVFHKMDTARLKASRI